MANQAEWDEIDEAACNEGRAIKKSFRSSRPKEARKLVTGPTKEGEVHDLLKLFNVVPRRKGDR